MKTLVASGACLTLAALALLGIPGYAQYSSPVTIKNTATQAVPTKDQYHLALATPVNFTDNFTMAPNVFGNVSISYVVPANQRLVLQFVSVICDLPGSADAFGLMTSDQGHPGTPSSLGIIVPTRTVPFAAQGPGFTRSFGGTPVQALFDAGIKLQIGAERTNGTGTATCFVGFSGYLVAVP